MAGQDGLIGHHGLYGQYRPNGYRGLRAVPRLRGGPRPLGRPLLHLVVCFVLGNDGGGNAAALTHLVTALLGPRPDFSAPLTARPTTRPPPTYAAARPACVIRILAHLFPEFLGVLGAQVDLVGAAVKGELNCLLSFDLAVVGKVADDRHLHLLSHGVPALPLGKYI
jgi:hypothetical protein